jgi:hypothetical protein
MTFGHERWRRRTALLACDALTGAERAAAEAHVRGCARCADELAGLAALRRLLDAEPAAAPVPVEALEARVLARLQADGDAAPARPASRPWAGRLAWPLAAAAAGALALWAVRPAPTSAPSASPAAVAVAESDEALPAEAELMRRMERLLAREQAARYLNEAQDVLVTVTAASPPCPRGLKRVEVEEEAQRRSRALLARRASLVELGQDEVASAQPVLAEVEEMLRTVADLPSCVRPGRLQALEREIGRRRLLMKIDLMTRELQG